MKTAIILLVAFLGGCVLPVPISYRSYQINTIDSCHVGAPLILTREGRKNPASQIFYGLERELIYCGISGNTMTLLHREYQGDEKGVLIRPGFSFSVQYDLGISKTVTFEDYLVEIIDANPSRVAFRVIADAPLTGGRVAGHQGPTSPPQPGEPEIIPSELRRMVEIEYATGSRFTGYVAGESATVYLFVQEKNDSTFSRIPKAAVRSVIWLK